jgi:hypothetical protein
LLLPSGANPIPAEGGGALECAGDDAVRLWCDDAQGFGGWRWDFGVVDGWTSASSCSCSSLVDVLLLESNERRAMMSSRVDAEMGRELRRVDNVRGGEIGWGLDRNFGTWSVRRGREFGLDAGGKNESCEVGIRRIWEVPFILLGVSEDHDVLCDTLADSSGVRALTDGCCWRDDLLMGMKRVLRRWIESEVQRWLAFRSSAISMPYLSATPASESFGVI